VFFKLSPVDEYHLPQMNSENVFFGCMIGNFEFSMYNGFYMEFSKTSPRSFTTILRPKKSQIYKMASQNVKT
jgi:hypothetical protein